MIVTAHSTRAVHVAVAVRPEPCHPLLLVTARCPLLLCLLSRGASVWDRWYAAHMVQGMQQEDAAGHPKMLAYLKHFTAYSTEANRGHDTYKISTFDLFDSYLAQYEIAFKEGKASGVMCSYDAENGRPSCANGYILNEVIRGKWNQTDAFVTTDCGAVSNMRGPPANAPTDEAAAAWTINNGTDLEMGSEIWTRRCAPFAGRVPRAPVDARAAAGAPLLIAAVVRACAAWATPSGRVS